jgi:hypothetical protein
VKLMWVVFKVIGMRREKRISQEQIAAI